MKFFTKEQIQAWLDEMKISHYEINNDLTVNVKGNVKLSTKKIIELPVKFNSVLGDFDISSNKLTTLEGSPNEVSGNFNCMFNYLPNLKGAPEKVGASFNCSMNRLTSFLGGPHTVGETFTCEVNYHLASINEMPLIAKKVVLGDISVHIYEPFQTQVQQFIHKPLNPMPSKKISLFLDKYQNECLNLTKDEFNLAMTELEKQIQQRKEIFKNKK
jgi:hypothetical protein